MGKQFKIGKTYTQHKCVGCGCDLVEWNEQHIVIKRTDKSIWFDQYREYVDGPTWFDGSKRYTLHLDDQGNEYATNKGKHIFVE